MDIHVCNEYLPPPSEYSYCQYMLKIEASIKVIGLLNVHVNMKGIQSEIVVANVN